MDVVDNPFVIGDFVWTAFDYIGEASIGWRGYWQKQDFFPWNLAYCGDIDICGWKRPQSYYRDALWKENQLSVWVTPPALPLNRILKDNHGQNGTGLMLLMTGTGTVMKGKLLK